MPQFSSSLSDKVAIETKEKQAIDVALQILNKVRPDLYNAHPRSELVKIARGEAIAALEVHGVKGELKRTRGKD